MAAFGALIRRDEICRLKQDAGPNQSTLEAAQRSLAANQLVTVRDGAGIVKGRPFR
jgi:hypothetical protein